MVATGYVLRFPLPPATDLSHTLWGSTRYEWGEAHAWASGVSLAVVAGHLVLHWRWVAVTLGRRFGGEVAVARHTARTGLVVAGVLAIGLAGFGWAASRGVPRIDIAYESVSRPEWPAAAPAPGGPEAAYFRREVWPVFERACLGCHGPGRPPAGSASTVRE